MIAQHEREHLEHAATTAGMSVEVVLPRHHMMDVGSLRLHCVDWGGSASEAIVFLHGGGLTARTWDLVCLQLRPRFRCIAVDQRGHGDSDWAHNGDYSTDAYVSDIGELLHVLQLRSPALIGMSLGGSNTLAFAEKEAARLGAAVIIDTGPDIRPKGGQKVIDFMKNSRSAKSLDEFVDMALAFNPRRNERLLRRSLLHNLRQDTAGIWTWKYDPNAIPKMDDVIRNHERLWEGIAGVTCPALVLRGGESDVLSREDAERFASRLPRGRWAEVAGAGHTVQGDQPAETARLIDEFLRDV
jgi:esterase